MSPRHGSRAAAAAALLALAAASVACLPASEGGADAAASVEVPALRTDLEITVPAEGELEATSASPVAVPRVPTGALKVKQLAPEGSIVEAGDIVVVFDDTELNIEIDNHRATFGSANRRIDRTSLQSEIERGSIEVMKRVAQMQRDNTEQFELVDETIYSRQEILEDQVKLEEATETIVFADASLLLRGEYYDIEKRILGVEKEQVRGKMDRVQYSLANLVLKAPIGGLLVYKKNWRGAAVAVGDSLWPGNVIMSIVDPASAALRAYVLEKDAAGLQVGAPAVVRVDARPEREFTGRVATVAELSRPIERGSPVKYTEVLIEIDDGDPQVLKPGIKGRARIVAGRVEDAVVVPRSAVRGEADRWYVLVAGAGGARRQPVKLGPGDLVRVSVAEGLDGGERVLLGDEPREAASAAAAPPAAPGGARPPA